MYLNIFIIKNLKKNLPCDHQDTVVPNVILLVVQHIMSDLKVRRESTANADTLEKY